MGEVRYGAVRVAALVKTIYRTHTVMISGQFTVDICKRDVRLCPFSRYSFWIKIFKIQSYQNIQIRNKLQNEDKTIK